MTTPQDTTDEWHLPTSEEEAAELRAVGITFASDGTSFPADPTELDVAASQVLRQIARTTVDRNRYRNALAREAALLAERYAKLTEPLEERIAWLTSIGHALASEARFPAKAKSRKVAWGSYGTRHVADKITITDKHALLAAAEKEAPELVDVKEERRVLQSAASAYFFESGVLLDGCTFEPEHEEPVLKPNIEMMETL